MEAQVLLAMRGIEKTFPGVKALRGVDLTIERGEVHALMGENGAGKSTLMKVLTGVHQRDAGEMLLEGKSISPEDPMAAQRAGISTIYQELNLVPGLSVCENICLGREPKVRGLIDWKAIETRAAQILKDMGVDGVDVTRELRTESVAIQQMVAIARAVSIDAKLLVMDEPTSSLSQKEVQILFRIIQKLKSQHISTVFISHKLDEVFEISDAVTVLRDGVLVGRYPAKDLTKLKLVSLMIGRDATSVLARKKSAQAAAEDREVVLKATKLSKGVRTKEVSIDVKKGEVVGIAGLLGSGRTELAKILFGDETPDQGQIELERKPVRFKSPRDAIRLRLGFCSEDRKAEGLFPNMSIMENMTMTILPKLSKAGVLSKKAQLSVAETYIEKLKIATAGPHQLVRQLSGGNQQKVLLARWLCKEPILLILDEPTRGIDLGGKSEIETLVGGLADGGVSILMISSEMEELIRSCDRIAVLSEGRKVGELTAREISEENLMHLMAHGSDEHAAGTART